jgi:hypothetical protein
MVLYGFVLTFVLSDATPKNASPLFVAVGALVGVASIAGVLWARSRPIPCDNPSQMVVWYRTNFYIGVAYANFAGLMGFVGTFIVDQFWPYLAGLAVSAVGFALIAPSNGNIRRREVQMAAEGCAHSLSEALRTPSGGDSPARPD